MKGIAMSRGWIYLRKQVSPRTKKVEAYCFGLTSNKEQRNKTYRKENPFQKLVEDYEAIDIHAAEKILKDFVVANGMRVPDNDSKDCLRVDCYKRFYKKWQEVKNEYSLESIKKREQAEARAREQLRKRVSTSETMTLEGVVAVLEGVTGMALVGVIVLWPGLLIISCFCAFYISKN